jgi:hypothetical protein
MSSLYLGCLISGILIEQFRDLSAVGSMTEPDKKYYTVEVYV